MGEPFESEPGTLENFLTERYCLYGADGRGNVCRGDIHHHLWPLQPAEAEVEQLTMTQQIGLELPETGPVLHFSDRLDVLAWSPRRITSNREVRVLAVHRLSCPSRAIYLRRGGWTDIFVVGVP